MARRGISLYPEHSTVQKDKAYIDLAAKYGYTRIFTCLLSVTEDVETIKKQFREINSYAHDKGFEVIFDVAPSVFKELGITYDNLSVFKEMCADGIRLDEGFTGAEEAHMTLNKEGLKVEINASQPTRYIDNILSYKPYKDKLITCHNFYPQKYSGLGYNLFYDCSKRLKDMNLNVAAFVSSSNSNTFGPWPIDEGLCTLEMHRGLPMDLQARHLYATGVVDDVLVANCFATEEELRRLAEVNPGKLTIRIELEENISDVEKEIIFDFPHFVRGDMSEYMARSTMSRIVYKDASIPAGKTPATLHRGDVVVLNDGYGRYKGELHIILQDRENDGRINLVGRIPEEEQILMEFIEPWKPFALIK